MAERAKPQPVGGAKRFCLASHDGKTTAEKQATEKQQVVLATCWPAFKFQGSPYSFFSSNYLIFANPGYSSKPLMLMLMLLQLLLLLLLLA